MRLIVGLGNPGSEYVKTRHNLGFIVLEYTIRNNGLKFDKDKFESIYTINGLGNNRVIYMEPMTFMNLSGNAVKQLKDFYKIDNKDILVVYDDKDLEIGKVRLRTKGSSGGHNGIKDIINKLGTDEFNRLRIGIGSDSNIPTASYVLGKFTEEQMDIVKKNLDRYKNIIDEFAKGKTLKELQEKC